MSKNSSTVPTTDKVNEYLQALTDLEGNISLMKQKELNINQKDLTKFLISIKERVELVSDLITIHPEDMPTCDGCGGQKQHPEKDFSYPPENGLCDNELKSCGPLEYYEGESCPLCEKDYDDNADNSQFFSHSEGGGIDDISHYYYCPHCNGKWVNVMSFTTEEVN
tara:strand:- start:765 stop:1262 length:498 start_codon:yes stop_codon:yes gene_type:complete